MSCCSEPGLLPVNLAIQKLIESLEGTACKDTEVVHIRDAIGRVLAQPIQSAVNVPPHDNSAMDGYALRFEDVPQSGGTLTISQRIPAGVDPEPLAPGTIARIFTGAPVPPGADTVVMQEDVDLDGDNVSFKEAVKPGAHIRVAGEDIREGQTVVEKGRALKAQDLGLIASVGIAEVTVYKQLNVAILVSGDELLEPGEAPQPGKIYNSNGYMLAPLMQQLGFVVSYQDNIPDTYEETVFALKKAAENADVVITTGGVSVGEEDHLKPAVEELGRLDLWKVNIKPGKPFAFGAVGGTPFIGLPGNPVSVFSTLMIMGIPYLRSLQGEAWHPPVPQSVPIRFTTKKAGRRDEYLRVKSVMKEGVTALEKYPNQGSGVLSSASWCDGFALIKAGDIYQEGDHVPFYYLPQLMGR